MATEEAWRTSPVLTSHMLRTCEMSVPMDEKKHMFRSGSDILSINGGGGGYGGSLENM